MILAIVYLLTPLYLVKHMGDMSEPHSMMASSDCQYLTGENSMCPISLYDHISAWKSILLVVLPSVLLLSSLYVLLLSVYFVLLSLKQKKLFLYLRREKYKGIYILFVNLFSKGILNSRAY